MVCLVVCFLFIFAARVVAQPLVATTVFGQQNLFTTNLANSPILSEASLSSPDALWIDEKGLIFVSDNGNRRVLRYPLGSVSSNFVLGQTVFSAVGTLNNPTGLTTDPLDGTLYLSEFDNNRVLGFSAPVSSGASASFVFGQSDLVSTQPNRGAGPSASSLFQPSDVKLDSQRNIWICDFGNNRVLMFSPGATSASFVLGQSNFVSNTVGTASAVALKSPISLALDPFDGVYVVDFGFLRIVYFRKGSNTATRVIGQADFTFSTFGVSSTQFTGPFRVALGPRLEVFVADHTSNRVLRFPDQSQTADGVFGQVSFSGNTAGLSNSAMNDPRGLAVDVAGNLIVSDFLNNRILVFGSNPVLTQIGTAPLVNGSLVLSQTSVISTPVTVNGNLKVRGAQLVLLSSLTVVGSFIASGLVLNMSSTASLSCAFFAIGFGSEFVPILSTAPAPGSNSVTFAIATYQTFGGGNFTMRSALANFTGSECYSFGSPQTNQGSSSLTVTVAATNLCNAGLSTGAIVGISVGCGVAAIGLTCLIVFLMRRARTQGDKKANMELRMKNIA